MQNLLIHEAHTHLYGVHFLRNRFKEINIRTVEKMLDRIIELDHHPLKEKRSPENRMVGNCRHFTVLLCSFLRHNKIPARARVGYENYSSSNFHGDHWICEYWEKNEWIQADAQLDAVQIYAYQIKFDVNDIPPDKFLHAGRVYNNCRADKLDPEHFGVFEDFKGFWHIKENLIRDFLVQIKIEILPWDHTAIMNEEKYPFSKTCSVLDSVAQLITSDPIQLQEIQTFFNTHSELHVSYQ